MLVVPRQVAVCALRTRNPGTGTRRFEKSILRTENPGTGMRNPWTPAQPQPHVFESLANSIAQGIQVHDPDRAHASSTGGADRESEIGGGDPSQAVVGVALVGSSGPLAAPTRPWCDRRVAGSVLRTRNPGTGTRRFEKSILRTENPGTGIQNPWTPAPPQPHVFKTFANGIAQGISVHDTQRAHASSTEASDRESVIVREVRARPSLALLGSGRQVNSMLRPDLGATAMPRVALAQVPVPGRPDGFKAGCRFRSANAESRDRDSQFAGSGCSFHVPGSGSSVAMRRVVLASCSLRGCSAHGSPFFREGVGCGRAWRTVPSRDCRMRQENLRQHR